MTDATQNRPSGPAQQPPPPAPPAAPIVEMTDIHLAFDKKVVLKGLNLAVAPRERLVIMSSIRLEPRPTQSRRG